MSIQEEHSWYPSCNRRLAIILLQCNRYDVVLLKHGAGAREQLARAVQQVFDECGGDAQTPRELFFNLLRLHHLRLQPFTNPFVSALVEFATLHGWVAMVEAIGFDSAAVPAWEWDLTTRMQKLALDEELLNHANDEREICH